MAQDIARQGDTLHVYAQPEVNSVRLNGQTVRLFLQADGRLLGLVPIPVNTQPGQYALEYLRADGSVEHKQSIAVRDAHFPAQNIVLGKELTELKPAPGETEAADKFRTTVSEQRYWEEPLQAPEPGCMTSLFGVGRLHNGKPTGNFHAGVDLRGAAGTPVRAAASGIVKLVRPWTLHGNTVGIDHGQGFESMYLHLSKFAVSEGAAVKQGDVIGYIGSTGRSTAPHLHWTLYVNGSPVNPAQWVTLRACAAKPSEKSAPRRRLLRTSTAQNDFLRMVTSKRLPQSFFA